MCLCLKSLATLPSGVAGDVSLSFLLGFSRTRNAGRVLHL